MSLLRAARLQSRVNLTTSTRSAAATAQRFSSSKSSASMTGVQPEYGPVGVSAALKWSPTGALSHSIHTPI